MSVQYVIVADQPTPPQRCNHVLHLLLTFITGGFWAPVWILSALNVAGNNRAIARQNRERRRIAIEGQTGAPLIANATAGRPPIADPQVQKAIALIVTLFVMAYTVVHLFA